MKIKGLGMAVGKKQRKVSKLDRRVASLKKKGYQVKVHGGYMVAVLGGERIEEKV